MSDESDRVVRIERTFAAPAEEVFDAWTSPDVIRRWFHCDSAWDTPVADVDLQVGGKIRVVMRRPDGTEVEAQGIFTLIDRPHRLVMTWTFDDDPSNEQLLELSFMESNGATTVLLVNSRISTDERRDEQANGWRGAWTNSTDYWPADSIHAPPGSARDRFVIRRRRGALSSWRRSVRADRRRARDRVRGNALAQQLGPCRSFNDQPAGLIRPGIDCR